LRRAVVAAALCTLLAVGPSQASPELRLSYPNGIPRVEIAGDWRYSQYTVWRASAEAGPYARVGDSEVLCMGACFIDDYSALGGRTYFYRFDLITPEGAPVSFGPYLAKISADLARPLSASITPNPGHGPAVVKVFAAAPAGTTIGAEVALFDLQGRRMKTLFHGPLAAGPNRFSWDGRDDHGVDLRAGLYLLRVASWDGRSVVTRVARAR
jgi:hypothetical protein